MTGGWHAHCIVYWNSNRITDDNHRILQAFYENYIYSVITIKTNIKGGGLGAGEYHFRVRKQIIAVLMFWCTYYLCAPMFVCTDTEVYWLFYYPTYPFNNMFVLPFTFLLFKIFSTWKGVPLTTRWYIVWLGLCGPSLLPNIMKDIF